MTNWWFQEGGKLTGVSQLSNFFDLYYAPEPTDETIHSHSMGKASEAARTFGIVNTAQLNKELRKLERPFTRTLANAQRLTIDTNQPQLTVEKIELASRGNSKVEIPYKRLYLPVEDATKRKYILNFSQRLPN